MSGYETIRSSQGKNHAYDDNFEPFDPKKAREEQERKKFDQLVVDSAQQLTEDAKEELLSRGVVAGEDPVRFYYDLRKSGLISNVEIADYVKSVKTPAKALHDGYHGLDSGQDAWSMACNAQFNLSFSKMDETTMMHSKRILEMFSGGDFNKPNNADANSYKAFLQRYPSALDFDVDSEAFLSKIGLVDEPLNSEGSKAKRAEYARDMAEFKKAMYGEQQSRLDAVKHLDTFSDQYGRLSQGVRVLSEIRKRAENESEATDDSSYDESDNSDKNDNALDWFNYDGDIVGHIDNDHGPVKDGLPLWTDLGYDVEIASKGYRTRQDLENANEPNADKYNTSIREVDGYWYWVIDPTKNW